MRRLSLRQAIRRIGLSKSDAASLLKVHRSTLWRWEKRIQTPRAPKAAAVQELISYARRLSKPHTNVEHRRQVLERRLSKILKPAAIAPSPVPSPPPPSQAPLPSPPIPSADQPPPIPSADQQIMNYIDLHEFIEEVKSQVVELRVNGKVINDTPLGWINDHLFERDAFGTLQGDDSRYWRITLDYRVSFSDGILSIDFDEGILNA